jgi:hypothetical protein
MKPTRNVSLPLVFILSSLLIFVASTAFSMDADDVEREVSKFFKQSEFIPHVRIIPTEEKRFVVELTFDIGDRWGRNEFARHLAKAAITEIFGFNLPLAQGIVRIYCTHAEVLHLAIGINQVKEISWKDGSTASEFFGMLRSRFRLGKRPEDRTYFIENKQIIKPSPTISISPDS